MTALLLIAHGSRQPEANDDLYHMAAALRRRGQAVVESFLELAEPDIDGGARRCVELGARRVVLVPYFLSAGVHVRRDLSAARERLAASYPHVEFLLAEPLGRHPLLEEVVAQRVGEACGGSIPPLSPVLRGEGLPSFWGREEPLTPNPSPLSTGERGEESR